MADTTIKVSDPLATIVDAGATVFKSIMDYSAAVRATESQASRDEEDHIRYQAYWDWRNLLHTFGIVGDPMPWPPPRTEPPK